MTEGAAVGSGAAAGGTSAAQPGGSPLSRYAGIAGARAIVSFGGCGSAGKIVGSSRGAGLNLLMGLAARLRSPALVRRCLGSPV
ncbi:MAG TPA: hypothetical protein VFU22_26475 [Roseiflexaceae bacterium]|nr:hypothetical protein [Roseiflexaceae bacterium]